MCRAALPASWRCNLQSSNLAVFPSSSTLPVGLLDPVDIESIATAVASKLAVQSRIEKLLYTYAEAAEATGRTPNALKTLVSRGGSINRCIAKRDDGRVLFNRRKLEHWAAAL